MSSTRLILISASELISESIAITGIRAALSTMIASAAAVFAAGLANPHLRSAREKGMLDWVLKRLAFLVVSALILHDVPEGFAMANAYLVSPEVGLLVALAIALHNLPEEFAMAVPAVTIGSKRFLFGAALLSALGVVPSLHAYFLAFAAGAMLFVSIREPIPMAKRYQHIGWFAGGNDPERFRRWAARPQRAG